VDYTRNIDELRRRVRAGWRPGYVLFLQPFATESTTPGSECLSQWYPAEMEIDGLRFPTAEHYMMWRKARLFGDESIAHSVLADESPDVAKQLGRRVRGFRADTWAQHRLEVVLRGSIAKFEQHPQLREYLLRTHDHVLAEASPVDNLWGIGFEAGDARAMDPLVWTGLNLLGFTLMQARAHFSTAPRL
jgi:ribA/ribD-fused uncharacterized protein